MSIAPMAAAVVDYGVAVVNNLTTAESLPEAMEQLQSVALEVADAAVGPDPDGSTSRASVFWVVVIFLLICHQKLLLWLHGIVFMFLSNESKGLKKAKDAATVVAQLESKIIIFVRHGESDWNQIFNKSKVLLLPRLIFGLFRELFMLPSSSNSVFIDSQLSEEGIEQALKLQHFLEAEPGDDWCEDAKDALRVLRQPKSGESVMVTSQLRRAVSTGLIGFWPRLQRTNEKVIVLASLQEMSRNVDTMALAPARKLPETSRLSTTLGSSFNPAKCLDVRELGSNKALFSRASSRMESFCEWCFRRNEQYIIVSASHSLWAKNFFKVYLPKDSTNIAKTHKMKNCGVVAFRLDRGVRSTFGTSETCYKVDPESVTELYSGFEKLRWTKPLASTKRAQRLVLPPKSQASSAPPAGHQQVRFRQSASTPTKAKSETDSEGNRVPGDKLWSSMRRYISCVN
eukprot:TRINITY_DN24573_c0_g2_i1.p1 TRINITY_DN24573_c0_g2~~TRINITY_DN24573_c0_g2_i1.p1  ORF type:complete len:457 (+),score=101.56 TRINITY_DN24573_c0_g2_i1:52-1422(+)